MYSAVVIGLGKIGLLYDFDPKRVRPSSHVSAYLLHSGIELVACADSCEAKRNELLQVAPAVPFYTNLKQMLQIYPADIISICTPPNGRLEVLKAVLAHSEARVIFCEKPLVDRTEEIAELRQLMRISRRLLIPNLSRRWNRGMNEVREILKSRRYGALRKIHVRYTRGIHNTGSHLFDLIRYVAGDFSSVQVIRKVYSSAEREGDPSFSFAFVLDCGATGYAEAFDDEHYYMFELDLFCDKGKIEIVQSGEEIRCFEVIDHPLFAGFKLLSLCHKQDGLLKEASLLNAVNHIVDLLDQVETKPLCSLEDGLYPLFVASALLRSYYNNGSVEKVIVIGE